MYISVRKNTKKFSFFRTLFTLHRLKSILFFHPNFLFKLKAITMRILLQIILLSCFTAISCTAQKLAITVSDKGNTGQRGRPMPGTEDVTPTGYDYYNLQINSNADCTLEIKSLWVKDKYILTPNFENGQAKTKLKKGKAIGMFAKANSTQPYTKAPKEFKGEALLHCLVNGKPQYIEIKAFREILPN
jgi:hypothetical protein